MSRDQRRQNRQIDIPAVYICDMATPHIDVSAQRKLTQRDWLILALTVGFSTLLCLLVHALTNQRHAGESVFNLSNLVGPTALSLLTHGDLFVSLGPMGSEGLGASGARMPLVPAFVAMLYSAFGTDDSFLLGFAKIICAQVPVAVTCALVMQQTPPQRTALCGLLMLLPFLTTPVIANVVSMQVEEGYAYGLIALTFAMLVFCPHVDRAQRGSSWPHVIAFAAAICLIYLTKSSYVLFCFGLCSMHAWINRHNKAFGSLPLIALCVTLTCWGTYQFAQSGKFHVGTSLDGINLRKGNNEHFLERYPPAPGTTLDEFDGQLSQGHIFANEWAFDAYHTEMAIEFISKHPSATLKALGRKIYQYFLSMQKIGSSDTTGIRYYWEFASLLAFRVTNLGAMAWALFALLIQRIDSHKRTIALIYLGTCILVAAPYLVGFAYTRHASVLFIPTAVLFIFLTSNHKAKGLNAFLKS